MCNLTLDYHNDENIIQIYSCNVKDKNDLTNLILTDKLKITFACASLNSRNKAVFRPS